MPADRSLPWAVVVVAAIVAMSLALLAIGLSIGGDDPLEERCHGPYKVFEQDGEVVAVLEASEC